jgi:hypothetical protein
MATQDGCEFAILQMKCVSDKVAEQAAIDALAEQTLSETHMDTAAEQEVIEQNAQKPRMRGGEAVPADDVPKEL